MDLHLHLFGVRLKAVAGKLETHELETTGARVGVELDVGGKTLSLAYEGGVPGGTLNFSARFSCTIEQDEVVLAAPTVPAKADVRYTFPLGLSGELAFRAAVSLAPHGTRLGIVLADHNQPFEFQIAQLPVSAAFATLAMRSPGGWSSPPWLSFYLAEAEQKPSTPHGILLSPREAQLDAKFRGLELRDELKKTVGGSGTISRVQRLAITRVRLGAQHISVHARPPSHSLFIHPDILDTADASDKSNNRLVHQQALVNGELVLKWARPGGADAVTASWSAREEDSAPEPGLLVFRLTDESGHPLLLEGPGFPLGHRNGVNAVTAGIPADKVQHEQTIQGLVIGTGVEGTPLKVRSIDPLRVDLTYADRERWWLDLDEPERVPVSTRPPAEIHGLARGVYLSTDQLPTNLTCSLAIGTIEHEIRGTIYTLPRIVLAPPTDAVAWDLVAQAEERELMPAGDGSVGVRMAVAQAPRALELPAFDTSLALANLASEKVASGKLLAEGVEWVRELDKELCSAFEQVVFTDQTHLEGFRMAPPSAQKVAGILDLPPGRAEALAATAQTGLVLKLAETRYAFGGSAATDPLLKMGYEANDRLVEPVLRAFAELWFGGWARPEQAVREGLEELRAYLDELRPAKLADEAVAGLQEATREILAGARVLPGFPREELVRLREAIKDLVATEQRFRHYWETEKDAAARALFDAVWSPAPGTLARRAVVAIMDPNSKLPAAAKAALKAALPIPTGADAWRIIGEQADLPGVPTLASFGLDPLAAGLAEIWKAPELESLRRKYGEALTLDVVKRLVTEASLDDAWPVFLLYARKYGKDELITALSATWESAKSLQALREKYGPKLEQAYDRVKDVEADMRDLVSALDPKFPATFLSRFRVEPPEYLFTSSRVPLTMDRTAAKQFEKLWNHAFRLCELPTGSWDFFLDGQSSAVVKLTGERDVAAILEEIAATYASPRMKDPLGMPVAELTKMLDPSIRRRSWRGIVVVRPTADSTLR